ncbi:MAG: hypothetical protein ACYSTL_01555, partial [Planctomycetota bacterium]
SRLNHAAILVTQGQTQVYSLSTYKFKLPPGVLQDAFSKALTKVNEGKTFVAPKVDEVRKGKDYDKLLGEAQGLVDEMVDKIKDVLDIAADSAEETVKGIEDKDDREKAKRKLRDDLAIARQTITRVKVEYAQQISSIRGEKIFKSLRAYEAECLNNALAAVRYGNIFGGLADYRARLRNRSIGPQAVRAAQAINVAAPIPIDDRAGFVYWVLLAAQGLVWLICEHWIYAAIFLLGSLAVVAFFGGAVHRIAALHFAREEKISIAQAIKFSFAKFISFFTAPLIPLVFILILGAILALGGIIGAIPYVGEILMGALFFLAIAAGLIITLLGIGLLGGFPLMYPTIAVEGSDSFDAISRSFNYIFARPWRAGLYGLVALVYGTITYLFVRLVAYMTLTATHLFVKWGVFGAGGRLHPDADKLDVMWTAPTFDNLLGTFNWEAMTGTMPVGAWLIGVWVFLVGATVFAYLLSYVGSATTVIYYLLRRKVDATDLDDVYVEEGEEELISTEAPPEPEEELEEEPAEESPPPPPAPRKRKKAPKKEEEKNEEEKNEDEKKEE